MPGHRKVGDYTQVYTLCPCLFQDFLHNSAFARRGKEYLVHELSAGILKQRLERSHHVARTGCGMRTGTGKFNEALERVSKMPNALQMVAKGVRFRSSAHDEHITRPMPWSKPAIKRDAIQSASASSE